MLDNKIYRLVYCCCKLELLKPTTACLTSEETEVNKQIQN